MWTHKLKTTTKISNMHKNELNLYISTLKHNMNPNSWTCNHKINQLVIIHGKQTENPRKPRRTSPYLKNGWISLQTYAPSSRSAGEFFVFFTSTLRSWPLHDRLFARTKTVLLFLQMGHERFSKPDSRVSSSLLSLLSTNPKVEYVPAS